MAYDFIPKNANEITKNISNKDIALDIITVFNYLTKQYKKVPDPLAIDKSKPKSVKIIRSIQSMVDLKEINKMSKHVKFSFGSGSRGGRGTANKGNAFEGILADDIERWFRGEELNDKTNQEIIDALEKEYVLSDYKEIKCIMKGEANTKRPLNFSGKIHIGKGVADIGADVTDVDVMSGGGLITHLSLKHGSTVTFFNVGVLKILKTSEIKNGTIENSDGLELLNLLGINSVRMCQIFNGNSGMSGQEDVTNKINKNNLEYFIQSGIGYGFQMVHKINKNKIKCFYVDSNYMKQASRVQSVVVHYGGKTGTGKRIDVEITTPKYTLKLNLRDSTGNNNGYPTRLMCDYSYN